MEARRRHLIESFFLVDEEGTRHRVLVYPAQGATPALLITALGEPVKANPDGTYTLTIGGLVVRRAE